MVLHDGYQWRNGLGQAAAVTVSPVVATIYTVIGSNANGCTDTASVVVDVLCPLKATSQTATFAGFAPMVTAETGDRWSLTDERDNKVYQAVKMPDGKYWMVQNLNYQEGLTFQQRANQPGTANGSGSYAIGSFWCPGMASAASSTQSACNIYGALYTWETAMMVDGRCSDEAHTNCGAAAWSESWMTGNYYTTGAASTTVKAQKNNARGAESSGGGGRGICPPNWHIPTHSEWTLLLDKVDGAGTGTAFQRQTAPAFVGTNNATGAGARLKAACVCLAGTCATNDYPAWTYVATYTQQQSDLYGLRVLPAGTRASNGAAFRERGTRGYFWLSSVYSTTLAYHRSFWHSDSRVTYNRSNRSFGVPVRCVFDGNTQ